MADRSSLPVPSHCALDIESLEHTSTLLSVRRHPYYPAVFTSGFGCPLLEYTREALTIPLPRCKDDIIRPQRRDPEYWHCCSCPLSEVVSLHSWRCWEPGCEEALPLCKHKSCPKHDEPHSCCDDCCVVWRGIEYGYIHKRVGDWIEHRDQERREDRARRSAYNTKRWLSHERRYSKNNKTGRDLVAKKAGNILLP